MGADDMGPTEDRERAEPVVDVRKEYARLQRQLQAGPNPAETVQILRQLGTYRRQIAFLDEGPPTPAVSEIPEPPTPPEPSSPPQPATSSDPAMPDPANPAQTEVRTPLVIRFLVEGPSDTDLTSVAARLRSQFQATSSVVTSSSTNLTLEWLEFSAGSFESAPITFQLVAVSGTGRRATRRALRAAVDAIIMVVDASPASVARSTGFVSEVLDDAADAEEAHRPEIVLLVHRTEQPGALGSEQVAAELLIESSVRVVATTEDGNGFYYGFAVTTNAAVRRAQIREGLGVPRTAAITLTDLLAPLGDDFHQVEDETRWRIVSRSSRARTEPQAHHRQARAEPPSEAPAPTRATAPTRTSTSPPSSPDIGDGQTMPPATESPVAATPAVSRGRRASALRRLISALRTPDSH